MTNSRLLELHQLLLENNLNIVGITKGADGPELQWAVEPTAQEQSLAAQLARGFDLSQPPKTRAEILTFVQGLSPAQRQRLVDSVLVEFIQSRPRLLERLP